MLNGGVTFIGLDNYIQVGDNIMIDASVLGEAPFNKPQSDSSKPDLGFVGPLLPDGGANRDSGRDIGFLLAHVEQIEHSFTVDPVTGARKFVTTVRFIRGIITDENGEILTGGSGFRTLMSPFSSSSSGPSDIVSAIDTKANDLKPEDELAPNVTVRSTRGDPQKTKSKESKNNQEN